MRTYKYTLVFSVIAFALAYSIGPELCALMAIMTVFMIPILGFLDTDRTDMFDPWLVTVSVTMAGAFTAIAHWFFN